MNRTKNQESRIKNYHCIVLLLVSCLLSLSSFSQVGAPTRHSDSNRDSGSAPRERVEALKVGFLTQRLNLTAKEAQAFWPVYNEYEGELAQLRKARRENLLNARDNWDQLSDAEVEKVVESELASRQQELDLLKKYHSRFKQVLPIKKVARLYKAQEDFKRELLERIKENRTDNGPRPLKRNK
jgi:hypothetical protein